MRQDEWPATTTNDIKYIRIAKLPPIGLSSSRLIFTVQNGAGYGGLGNSIDVVYVTSRDVGNLGLSPSTLSKLIQVRKLGENVNETGSMQYGIVLTVSGSLEVWAKQPAYVLSAKVNLNAASGVEYMIGTPSSVVQSDQPAGVLWATPLQILDQGNTTKGSDGSLKAASPVARIASPYSTERPDIDEDSFEWCGYGVANMEAHGIEIIRDEIGMYRVTGAKSLASSGWRLLPPRDPDGSGDLGVVTAEQQGDEIIVSLFRRKMILADGEIVIQPGEPIDVPANSWIDVRLDMPEPIIPPGSPVEEPQIQPE